MVELYTDTEAHLEHIAVISFMGLSNDERMEEVVTRDPRGEFRRHCFEVTDDLFQEILATAEEFRQEAIAVFGPYLLDDEEED